MQTTLAERLKIAMEGPPHVTGRALASACSVKPPSVSDWLSGKSKTMEGGNLLAAAEFLRVRAKWLADGIGPMRGEATSPASTSRNTVQEPTVAFLLEPKPDRMDQELLELFSQLDPESRREYLMHLRGFVAGRRPHELGNALAMAGK